MEKLLIEAQYLPPLEFFSLISQFEEIHLDAHENYLKQTYRNRCYINGANKVIKLTIPVKHHGKIAYHKAQTDDNHPWQNEHWNSIQSSYGNAPFFEFYADSFREVIFGEHQYLFDFNLQLLTICLQVLKLNLHLKTTQKYVDPLKNEYFDGRSLIHPKRNFELNGFYTPVRYYQIFGKKFVENLSIIDLIFCAGPEAGYILKKSTINEWKQ